MHHNNSQPSLSSDIALLKSHIKQINSSLAQLSHTVSSNLHGMDVTLEKGSGVHPIKKRKIRTLHAAAAPFSQQTLLKGIMGGMGSGGGSSSRLSSGQMLADLASAITRTIGRDL